MPQRHSRATLAGRQPDPAVGRAIRCQIIKVQVYDRTFTAQARVAETGFDFSGIFSKAN